MTSKRRHRILSLLLAGALLLASGGADGAGRAAAQATPADTGPAVGGDINYAVPADPDSLAPFWHASPYATEVTARVYGHGLLRLGLDLMPEPALAEAMPEVSPDQKTYTFTVRQGVTFHDGTPVTAEDFAFTYHILMSDEYQGPAKALVDPIASVQALDQYTLEITTKDLFAPFLSGSAMVAPLPHHLLSGIPVADLPQWEGWRNPVGAGAWRFVEWQAGQHILLERNPNYWETGQPGIGGGTVGPFMERLWLRVIPDEAQRLAALEAGELTYARALHPEHVDRLKETYADRLVGHDSVNLGYAHQIFNNEVFPTNIKEVRQALSYGLNREAIIFGPLNYKAMAPQSFVPPMHWVYDHSLRGYHYDQARAMALIEQAGFTKNAQGMYEKDGEPLKLRYVAATGDSVVAAIAQQSKADWQAIGVEMEVELVDVNILLNERVKSGDFHVAFASQEFSINPHYTFSSFHSRNIRLVDGINEGSNAMRYSNPAVDALIDEGAKIADPFSLYRIYNQAQQLIMADAPANWIYMSLSTDFITREVQGVRNIDGYGIGHPMWGLDQQWYLPQR